MRRLTKQQMIEMVRKVGESITNRAEDIVGDYKHLDELSLFVSLETKMDELPYLDVDRKFIPAELFDYVASDKFVVDGRSDE